MLRVFGVLGMIFIHRQAQKALLIFFLGGGGEWFLTLETGVIRSFAFTCNMTPTHLFNVTCLHAEGMERFIINT